MCSSSDGSLLATVDLPAYLSSRVLEDDLLSATPLFSSSSTASSSSSPASSFRLLQVSADLGTAVAVTEAHSAIAVDLSHYFRFFFFVAQPFFLFSFWCFFAWRGKKRIQILIVKFLFSRTFPGHLLCAGPPSHPSVLSPHPADQDSLSSASCSLAALGATFSPDR